MCRVCLRLARAAPCFHSAGLTAIRPLIRPEHACRAFIALPARQDGGTQPRDKRRTASGRTGGATGAPRGRRGDSVVSKTRPRSAERAGRRGLRRGGRRSAAGCASGRRWRGGGPDNGPLVGRSRAPAPFRERPARRRHRTGPSRRGRRRRCGARRAARRANAGRRPRAAAAAARQNKSS